MKKQFLTIFVLAAILIIGFSAGAVLVNAKEGQSKMKRVTGIGGIFFKCKDPEKLKEWYKVHLGFDLTEYGVKFDDDTTKKGSTIWSPFSEKTKYFEPSSKDFMINYRVENLEALIIELNKEGVTILDKMETYDFGKFIHILDLEGNKIELWEPIIKP